MSTASAAHAEASSLIEEAKSRRKSVQLAGWSIGAVAAVLILLKLTALTAREVFLLFGAVAPPALPVGAGRRVSRNKLINSDAITADKVKPIIAAVTAELERWHTIPRAKEEDVLKTAGLAVGGFEGVVSAVEDLQESLVKSRSLSSVVGIRSWDAEQSLLELKETAVELDREARNVFALKERNFEEHKADEERNIKLDAEGAVRQSPEREHRREALKFKFTGKMSELGLKDLWARVEDLRKLYAASATSKEATEMAEALREDFLSENNGAKSEHAIDKEILKIAREEVLAVAATGFESGKRCLSLSEGKNITRGELERYGADRTGRPDYAMDLAGGSVINDATSKTYLPKTSGTAHGYADKARSVWRQTAKNAVGKPEIAISPASGIGKCWPMEGSNGSLAVQLSEPVYVESVSIEHEARAILPNKGVSAPKKFSVVGHQQGKVPGSNTDTDGDELLTDARYLLEGDVIQVFKIAEKYRSTKYEYVSLKVKSNHGEGAYTCLYRFRVHGHP